MGIKRTVDYPRVFFGLCRIRANFKGRTQKIGSQGKEMHSSGTDVKGYICTIHKTEEFSTVVMLYLMKMTALDDFRRSYQLWMNLPIKLVEIDCPTEESQIPECIERVAAEDNE